MNSTGKYRSVFTEPLLLVCQTWDGHDDVRYHVFDQSRTRSALWLSSRSTPSYR